MGLAKKKVENKQADKRMVPPFPQPKEILSLKNKKRSAA